MGRAPCCDKVGLKKGPWTPEEDRKLIHYIQKHGHGSWRALPKKAGLLRCGKSCRLRWTNYLRPDIKRGNFSLHEEQVILQQHELLGNRWSNIATQLPGRTDNEIKNYWNTHLKKRLMHKGIDPVTHRQKTTLYDSLKADSLISSTLSHMVQWESARLEAEARLAGEHQKEACVDLTSLKCESYSVSSDDTLKKLLESIKGPKLKDPNLNESRIRNSAYAWGMNLSFLIQKWDQSLQSKAAGRSASKFDLTVENQVISDWSDIVSKLNQPEMFDLQGLDQNTPSPTSTPKCSIVDSQTLPFLETSSPGVEGIAREYVTLKGKAGFHNCEAPLEAILGDSSLDVSCSSGHELFEDPNQATAFTNQESAHSDGDSQLWAAGNRFFSSVNQDIVDNQSLAPLVVTAKSKSPKPYNEYDDNVYQADSVISVLDMLLEDDASSQSESANLNHPTAAVPGGEDGDNYWSSILNLVGTALCHDSRSNRLL